LYESGDWNGQRPYTYDQNDPLGKKIQNKLLSNYMSNRRGNCVTMPLLFIILADRMGLDATASLAPLHMFVKYTDDTTGKTFNLETTSGAHVTRDEWYKEQMPMTDAAIANGVYMKKLSRKETLAVMAEIVLEHCLATKQYEHVILVAEALLEAYPSFADALVFQGTAYGYLLDERYYKKFSTPADISPDRRNDYQRLTEKNHQAFERAESLGWRETN
jgi:regulator of sirC expression with transglutaminase-like and TPR domain